WLMRHQFFTPRLERLYASEALLSAFDVDRIEPEALLWQTGYLTIGEVLQEGDLLLYGLTLPNREVRMALNTALTRALVPGFRDEASLFVLRTLRSGDAHALGEHMTRLFAGIPADWYRKNPMARYEGYFASVFYSHLAAVGVTIIPEDVSHLGRCDLTVRAGDVTTPPNTAPRTSPSSKWAWSSARQGARSWAGRWRRSNLLSPSWQAPCSPNALCGRHRGIFAIQRLQAAQGLFRRPCGHDGCPWRTPCTLLES
ncbi:MAG: hypothetical protein JG774_1603, partial [Desulfomicrobiaceae bacterium]|nr:hypothetical protein [Desulfomicrobiaceae bacterium]